MYESCYSDLTCTDLHIYRNYVVYDIHLSDFEINE